MTRVLIVDDNEVIRRGVSVLLRRQPDLEVVGTAASGEEGIALAAELLPDVVVMDIQMPGMGGVAATRMIVASGLGARVLVLSGPATPATMLDLVAAGAAAHVDKSAGPQHLLECLRAVARGEQRLGAASA